MSGLHPTTDVAAIMPRSPIEAPVVSGARHRCLNWTGIDRCAKEGQTDTDERRSHRLFCGFHGESAARIGHERLDVREGRGLGGPAEGALLAHLLGGPDQGAERGARERRADADTGDARLR